MIPMDNFPDQLVWEILAKLDESADRNAVSLTSKRLYEIEREQREYLHLGYGLKIGNESLISLCHRFRNLRKIHIQPKLEQLDDQVLYILSKHCPSIVDVTLRYCIYITDGGIGHLASCSKLMSVKLTYCPAITGSGILSLAVGCKNLRTLHLIRCNRVSNLQWLVYLGELGTLEDLSLKHCKEITEKDLVKLGPGLQNLKRLRCENDLMYRDTNVDRHDHWKKCVPCESMEELSLYNCLLSPERGISCSFGQYKALKELYLDKCVVVTDFGISSIKQVSKKLFEECPIQMLHICCLDPFNDDGMEGLCLAAHLETLELVKCNEVTDEGLKLVVHFPNLQFLRLFRCLGLTDEGIAPLLGSDKLQRLIVENCPHISELGVQGAAKSVTFKQHCLESTDLSLCLPNYKRTFVQPYGK